MCCTSSPRFSAHHAAGLLVVLLTMLFAVTLYAQEATTYTDPAGRFSAPIPAGWTDASTAEFGLLLKDDVRLYLLVVEADEREAGVAAALALAAPSFDANPMVSASAPLPSGTWTQDLYLLDDGSISVVLSLASGGTTYVVFVQAPNQAAAVTVNADLLTLLNGVTLAEGSEGAAEELTAAAAEPLTEAKLDDLDAYIESAVERFGVPGAAVAVVQGGEIVYVGTFGVTEMGGETAVDRDTRFMIGSTTKSLTTLLMATLVDDGLLDWDQPVTDILPTFTLSDREVTPQIRVRDLVNNSSGVPRWDVSVTVGYDHPEQVIEELAEVPLVAAPGEQFNYSNQMVAAGGYVTALAGGATYGDDLIPTFERLMNERVFAPLGMTRTTFDYDAAISDPNHASGHGYNAEVGEFVVLPTDIQRFYVPVGPAGTAWSTIDDMARYMQMQFTRGVAADGARVVSEANLDETQTPGVAVDALSGGGFYGMGWWLQTYRGLTLVQHGGATIGFTCDFAFLPEADLGVVVLSNRFIAVSFGQAVREYVFELAFNLEHEADARLFSADQALVDLVRASGVSAGEPLPPDAAALVGEYERNVSVRLDGDRLMLVTPIWEAPLYATEAPDVFLTGGLLSGFSARFETHDGLPTLMLNSSAASGSQPPLVLAKVE